MKKELVAAYLNEHPEFFNEYPELLQKIKSIDHNDLPLEPLQTLSIADRIIKRALDDKEHMKSRLEWFVEIIEANEALQENLFEIERVGASGGSRRRIRRACAPRHRACTYPRPSRVGR